VLSYSPTL